MLDEKIRFGIFMMKKVLIKKKNFTYEDKIIYFVNVFRLNLLLSCVFVYNLFFITSFAFAQSYNWWVYFADKDCIYRFIYLSLR